MPQFFTQNIKEPIPARRVPGYDLARAFAVFGMVIVNFKLAMGAAQNGPAWLVGFTGLIDGRAAATFVVLAGAGLSLLSQKSRALQDHNRLAGDRRILLRRALFLFIAGLLYTPIWPADILHFYGVYIGIGAFLLTVPARHLWAISGGLVLAFVVLFATVSYDQGWNWETLQYHGLWTPAGMVRHLFYNGFHPVVPWLAFLLVGMVLGRQNMGDPIIRQRVFLWGAAVTLLAEGASCILIRTLSAGATPAEQEAIVAIFGTAPLPPMPFYMLAGAGTAYAVIAVSIALGEHFRDAPWLPPLVATGRLAFTLYLAHVIVGLGILEMMGRLENQGLPFALLAALVFCTASVMFAHLWLRRFPRGPIESIMRGVTDR